MFLTWHQDLLVAPVPKKIEIVGYIFVALEPNKPKSSGKVLQQAYQNCQLHFRITCTLKYEIVSHSFVKNID